MKIFYPLKNRQISMKLIRRSNAIWTFSYSGRMLVVVANNLIISYAQFLTRGKLSIDGDESKSDQMLESKVSRSITPTYLKVRSQNVVIAIFLCLNATKILVIMTVKIHPVCLPYLLYLPYLFYYTPFFKLLSVILHNFFAI